MLITREMDYAIRAVRALADGEKHNIKEMCIRDRLNCGLDDIMEITTDT